MKTKFSKTDLACVIGDEWSLLGDRIRVDEGGLHLVESTSHDSIWFHPEPENPVLPFPFTLEQFRAFCDWHPTFHWEAIESVFTNDDGTIDDKAINSLNDRSGAADLVRAVLANHDSEYLAAWAIHEQIDHCKAAIERWQELERKAPTPSEVITAEHRLVELRQELEALSRQVSGAEVVELAAEQASPPVPAQAAPASPIASTKESPEQRQARRYQMCIDVGLEMPISDYGPWPRGIGSVAKTEGITRQAFQQDVGKHITRLAGKKQA